MMNVAERFYFIPKFLSVMECNNTVSAELGSSAGRKYNYERAFRQRVVRGVSFVI